jgi:hypothetical protein
MHLLAPSMYKPAVEMFTGQLPELDTVEIQPPGCIHPLAASK